MAPATSKILAMIIACPMDKAPLPIDVPKLHHRSRMMTLHTVCAYIVEWGNGMRKIDKGGVMAPVGNIVGTDAKCKAIRKHSGAAKDPGQLCGHLHGCSRLSSAVVQGAQKATSGVDSAVPREIKFLQMSTLRKGIFVVL